MKFSKRQLKNAKKQLRVFKEEQKSTEEIKEENEIPLEPLTPEDAKLFDSLSKKGKNITIVNSDKLPAKQPTIKNVKKSIKNSFEKKTSKMIFSFNEGDIVSFKKDYQSNRALGIYMRERDETFCDVVTSAGISTVRKSGIRKI
jgi:ribosome-binding ATPase YchF (GTP1/OBG family)